MIQVTKRSFLCCLLYLTLCEALEIPMNRQYAAIFNSDVSEGEKYQYWQGEYTTTIYLGTPPQKIENVVMDTGSYMPWFKV